MAISLSITEDSSAMKKRLECLKYLSGHRVDVGLTSSASERSRTLLAIHEHCQVFLLIHYIAPSTLNLFILFQQKA